MRNTVDCGPLDKERGAIVTALVEGILSQHPGLTGFLLHGSVTESPVRLPHSDEDIFYIGSPDESLEDERMRGIALFTFRGLAIHLCKFFFGDISQPETLSLTSVVSLHRSHILWEREGALSEPMKAVHALLADKSWVSSKFDDLIRDAEQFASVADDAYFEKHGVGKFFWTAINRILSVVAVANLRAPSFARKGLMETTICSNLCDCPEVSDLLIEACGATHITAAEMSSWAGRLDRAYLAAKRSCPSEDFPKHRYHVAGIQRMIDLGYHREAVWPLWRGMSECSSVMQKEGTDRDASAVTDVGALGHVLGVDNKEGLAHCVDCYRRAAQILSTNKPSLVTRLNELAVGNIHEETNAQPEDGAVPSESALSDGRSS